MTTARRRFVPVALLVLAGCGPADEVRTYDVPKELVTIPIVKIEPPASGTPVRTLAAIIPVDAKYSRFVKLSGPANAVAPHAADFRAFVASVRLTPDLKKPVEYTVPAGWRPAPKRQFVEAAFQAGPRDAVVEVTVSDPLGGDVAGNVNRWREQVGLPPISDPAELQKTITEIPLGGAAKASVVDLPGVAPAGGGMMRGPFQK